MMNNIVRVLNENRNTCVVSTLIYWVTMTLDRSLSSITKIEFNQDFCLEGIEGLVAFFYYKVIVTFDDGVREIAYYDMLNDEIYEMLG